MMKLAKAALVAAALLFAALVAAAFPRVAQAQDKLPPEYRLGAGDNIRISVFQNPNLTLETRVNEDATISYPMVGRVRPVAR